MRKKIIRISFFMMLFFVCCGRVFASENGIRYSSHVQDYGWMASVFDGSLSGTTGLGKRMEAYMIDNSISNVNGDIWYRSYVEGYGWQDYVSSGNISGTVGEGKRIEMIQIKLTGDMEEKYDIYYHVHVANIGWLDWASNDQITGSLGYQYQIEAFEVKLVNKGAKAPGNTNDIYREKSFKIAYIPYVQNYGWLQYVDCNQMAGTTGQGKRLEAFQIRKSETSYQGDVLYRSYVEGYGWQDYVGTENTSGTLGQGKKIEMIQIKLTDDLEEKYDIYYRVHVASIGWLDWASNDQITGSFGYNYQIEAIEINLVEKGKKFSGNTSDIYRENKVDIRYQTYLKGSWQKQVSDGQTSGTTGQGIGIDGFQMSVNGGVLNDWIAYRSYIEGIGWQSYVLAGNSTGNFSSDRKMEMIQIELADFLENYYDIYYRVHVASIGWLDWASNNQITGSLGYGYAIEAIEVKLIKKGEELPSNTDDIYRENTNYLTYSAHVQNYGWIPSVYSGRTMGAVGESKRMEAIQINLNNVTLSGDLRYSAHVQDYGWMDYVSSGEIAGSIGKSKRMEAIKMELTGELAAQYDIYYRTYVEDFGWLDWACNGEIAGSISVSKRIEGIQILLVNKGEDAPGKTDQSYVDSMFRVIDGKTYYYSNGVPVSGFQTIMGTKYFFNSSGVLIADNVRKVIDVSSHQKNINWASVKNDGVDGAIIRLGYGTSYTTDACVEDSYFATNYYATSSLGILSGIYLYSYAIDSVSAELEAKFVLQKLAQYHVDKSIPIYYDLEGNAWTNNLISDDYNTIVTVFANLLENNGYSVKVYSYKYWAENKFNSFVKSKLSWIAHYSDYCTYNGTYDGWQYTDQGTIAGISGMVDVSVWLR